MSDGASLAAGELAGRTALVAGGTRGIGRAVALELAAGGAQVAIHGRSVEGAADVAGMLAADGRHAGTFLADLTRPEAAATALDMLGLLLRRPQEQAGVEGLDAEALLATLAGRSVARAAFSPDAGPPAP